MSQRGDDQSVEGPGIGEHGAGTVVSVTVVTQRMSLMVPGWMETAN